jgi:hypothetical protein
MPDGVQYEGVFGSAEADAVARASMAQAGGSVAALRAAPYGATAKYAREERGDTARRTLAAPAQNAGPALVDAAPPPPPSPRVQTRLAPELLALATAPGTAAVTDRSVVGGRVHVAVTLRALGERDRQALIAAGLTIETAEGSTVVGWIAVEKLVALAEVDGIERVARAA